MPPHLTQEQRDALKADVEQAMLGGIWSFSVSRMLAQKHGVHERHPYSVRKGIINQAVAQAKKDTTPQAYADFLMRVRGAQQGARKEKQFGKVGQLLKLEAEVEGWTRPEVIDARTMVYAPGSTVNLDVKVDQTLQVLESQLSGMGLDQLGILMGELEGGEVIDGDAATPSNGGNGGGRPLLVSPSGEEEAPDGDEEAGSD